MLGLLWLLVQPATPLPLDAAEAAWSPVVVVSDAAEIAGAPQIVVDAYGLTHLFYIARTDGASSNLLFHVSLSDAGPSAPVDVLLDVGQDYRDLRVAADHTGGVHVIFRRSVNLYHASVDGQHAGNAGRWSRPRVVASATLGAALSIDAANGLHVCLPDDQAVLHTRSVDGGQSWSDPVTVTLLEAPSVATHLACATQSGGQIVHLAYVEVAPPNYYPPDAVYYVRSQDGGVTWSGVEQMAGRDFGLPEMLAGPDGVVHVLWQGTANDNGGRYYRRLEEHELIPTWSDFEILPVDGGGFGGDAPLALDGDGRLHVITAAPRSEWLTRDANGWSDARTVPTNAEPRERVEYPAMAIADGNEMYVAHVVGAGKIEVVSALLDAPARTAVPPPAVLEARPNDPSPDPTSTGSAPAQAEGQIEAPSEGPSSFGRDSFGSTDGADWIVFIGPALALLIVAVALLGRRRE